MKLDFSGKQFISIEYINESLVIEIKGRKKYYTTKLLINSLNELLLKNNVIVEYTEFHINNEEMMSHEYFNLKINETSTWKKYEGDKELKIVIKNVPYINTKFLLPYDLEMVRKSNKKNKNIENN